MNAAKKRGRRKGQTQKTTAIKTRSKTAPSSSPQNELSGTRYQGGEWNRKQVSLCSNRLGSRSNCTLCGCKPWIGGPVRHEMINIANPTGVTSPLHK